MKVIIFERYGSSDVLEVAEVEMPIPSDHQVLVRVRAASVNPADCGCMTGAVRFMTGLSKPRNNRLGLDVSGHVEAVGAKVTRFKPGDEVFGACIRNPYANSQAAWTYDYGSFAEYTVTHEGALAHKPDNITFEEAAAAPSVAWTALQGLRFGRIRAGQKVLISSATGGIGTFAVQMAKAFGAEVTGVCSTRNVALVRSLGADQVIDYTKENYAKQGQRYDLIFDSVGEHSLSTLRRALNPGGSIVIVAKRTGGSFADFIIRILAGTVMSRFIPERIVTDYSRPNPQDLLEIEGLLASGKIRSVIEKCYSGLAEVPQAVQHVDEGHAWGKAVIAIQPSAAA